MKLTVGLWIFKIKIALVLCFFCSLSIIFAQPSNHGFKFEQITDLLPDANRYRGMDGAPGPDYWQQRCDYQIECRLDTETRRLYGDELITYHNQSPHTLNYLWLQLDENQHSINNDNQYFDPSKIEGEMSEADLRRLESWRERGKHGVNIEGVEDANGERLKYFINQTMMRVDMMKPLLPGHTFSFRVRWNFFLIDRIDASSLVEGSHARNLARGGYEFFPGDGNDIFTITQWYPRLCVYSDFQGWQNKQFTGRGEFALGFGNFTVKMTVPDDFVVGSTGECLNYETILTEEQMKRWKQAQSSKEPVEIVTLEEALKNEKAKKSNRLRTWIYQAENVRDFAWTASRKFVWDAMPHINSDGKKVMCMSYYGKEAYPIYRRYSTKAVEHTLYSYSKYSFPYPYPVAISVEAASGMEYPMICFNPGRAEEDGTYSEGARNAAISVIIHEVGHNYFPMIVNSDERQWSWFDEGINSFVQFLAESEFDNNYKTMFGPAERVVDYMSLPKDQLEPIMTNSDNIVHFGPNAYTKPASALNILRETVMGRELFDTAFKEYCRRWMFKHPTPADFFRTMEDASGVDLDWFWRGWFYSIDAVDISLDSVIWYKVDLENDPQKRETVQEQKLTPPSQDISRIRNRESGMEFKMAKDSTLRDFYTDYQPWNTADSIAKTKVYLYDELYSAKEKKEKYGDLNYYELQFSNRGGLVMPVILEWTFEDGSKEIQRIPVEVWRHNEKNFSKVFMKDKKVTAIRLDPYKETADVDTSNNNWPEIEFPTRFQIFKKHRIDPGLNPMQKAKKQGRS